MPKANYLPVNRPMNIGSQKSAATSSTGGMPKFVNRTFSLPTLWICVCVYIYIYVCVYVYVCVYIYIYIIDIIHAFHERFTIKRHILRDRDDVMCV